MMIFDIFGQGELHEYYPLKEPFFINNQLFNQVDIWQHYKINHGNYITDEIILELVNQLKNSNYPINKSGVLKFNNLLKWRTYQYDKLYIEKKAYRLIWYIEDNSNTLHILNCFRKQKYDKKE